MAYTKLRVILWTDPNTCSALNAGYIFLLLPQVVLTSYPRVWNAGGCACHQDAEELEKKKETFASS